MGDDEDDDPSVALLKSLDQLIVRIGRARTEAGLAAAAEEDIAEVEGDLLRGAADMTAYRLDVAREIATKERVPLAWLDLGLVFSHRVNRTLVSGPVSKHVPDDVRHAFLELGMRSINVGYEVATLLGSGLRMGAHARWRTLYEIAVVARVLEEGNRWTARRFLHHRYVFAAKGIETIPAVSEGLEGSRRSVVAKRNQALRRYGKAFGTTYGWAAELSKRRLGVDRPQFHHLERLAHLPDYPVIGHYAHHHVHADSMGNSLLHDSGTVHHGAADWDSEAAVIAGVTLDCLTHVGQASLRAWGRHDAVHARWYRGASALAEEIRNEGIRQIMNRWPQQPTGTGER